MGSHFYLIFFFRFPFFIFWLMIFLSFGLMFWFISEILVIRWHERKGVMLLMLQRLFFYSSLGIFLRNSSSTSIFVSFILVEHSALCTGGFPFLSMSVHTDFSLPVPSSCLDFYTTQNQLQITSPGIIQPQMCSNPQCH